MVCGRQERLREREGTVDKATAELVVRLNMAVNGLLGLGAVEDLFPPGAPEREQFELFATSVLWMAARTVMVFGSLAVLNGMAGMQLASYTAGVGAGVMLIVMAGMRFWNRSQRRPKLARLAWGLWVLVYVALALTAAVPVSMHILAGGLWSDGDVLLLVGSAPFYTLLFFGSMPGRRWEVGAAIAFHVVSVVVLVFLDRGESPFPERNVSAYAGVKMFTHAVFPVAVALALRRKMGEFLWWREALTCVVEVSSLGRPCSASKLYNELCEPYTCGFAAVARAQ